MRVSGVVMSAGKRAGESGLALAHRTPRATKPLP